MLKAKNDKTDFNYGCHNIATVSSFVHFQRHSICRAISFAFSSSTWNPYFLKLFNHAIRDGTTLRCCEFRETRVACRLPSSEAASSCSCCSFKSASNRARSKSNLRICLSTYKISRKKELRILKCKRT